MLLLALTVTATVLAAAAAYAGFLRFRARARSHLLQQPDIEWRAATATGMVCAVLGYLLEVDLATTYAYRWRRRADERTLFDELAAALRSRVPLIEAPPFPLVRDRILPLVRRTDALPPQDGYRAANHLVRRPFDRDLTVVYVIDGHHRRTYVTEGMAGQWNTNPAELHRLAEANLGAYTRHLLAELGGRRSEYLVLDGYEAARILVADLIIPDGVTAPVIGIPDEHACLIADESRQADLMARVTAMFLSAHAPLTPRVYTRDEISRLLTALRNRKSPAPSSGRADRPASSASSVAAQRSGNP